MFRITVNKDNQYASTQVQDIFADDTVILGQIVRNLISEIAKNSQRIDPIIELSEIDPGTQDSSYYDMQEKFDEQDVSGYKL